MTQAERTASHPTPGPWRQGIKHPARIIGDDDTIVGFAVQFTDDDATPNETELANARLIAKAPEMRDMLTEMAQFFMNGCACQLSTGFTCIVHRARALLVAIEKGA